MAIERRRLTVAAPDGAHATLQLHLPAQPRAWLYWLPALGVGIAPNEPFADALAARGIGVAIHEWRGLGSSDRRAGRRCDWGYRTLLDLDLPAGLEAAREAFGACPAWIGGHSLGGQFALLQAARAPQAVRGALLVASGQPHWRQFRGLRAAGVWAFAAAMPLVTHAFGHFPGKRLGFAGREAGQLMREWARTCRRGDYRTGGFGTALDDVLAAYEGRVLALRMTRDTLAPRGAIERLQALAPGARWDVRDLGPEHFARRRADHFGWLREPAPIVEAFAAEAL